MIRIEKDLGKRLKTIFWTCMTMSKGEKPIGYWLKEADKSISAKVNQKLNKFDLTRFHWQVLNTVYEKKEH